MPLLDTLTRALDAQDPDASAHASRVAALAEIVARRLGLARARAAASRRRAPRPRQARGPAAGAAEADGAHGRGDRAHPRASVRPAPACSRRSRPYDRRCPYVLFHHERWDGDGYPTGRGRRPDSDRSPRARRRRRLRRHDLGPPLPAGAPGRGGRSTRSIAAPAVSSTPSSPASSSARGWRARSASARARSPERRPAGRAKRSGPG